MKNLCIIAAIALFAFALTTCKSPMQHAPAAPRTAQSYLMLDSADIFSESALAHFAPGPDAVAYAHKLSVFATDLFVNKRKVKESLPVFLQSLRTAPDTGAYLKYADALYAAGQYEAASAAYYQSSSAETMRREALLGQARCASLRGDYRTAEAHLETAIGGNPLDNEQIRADPAFDGLRDDKLLSSADGGEIDPALRMKVFERNFHKASLPFSIPLDSLYVNDGQHIDYRLAELVPGMAEAQFSRSVSKDFQYVAGLDLSPSFRTFVYRSLEVNADTLNPEYYYVMTVDKTAKIIQTKEIACSCTPLTLTSATIDARGMIEIKEVEQTWKEDPFYYGYMGNKVVNREVKAVRRYQIQADGNIREIKPAKNGGPEQAAVSK